MKVQKTFFGVMCDCCGTMLPNEWEGDLYDDEEAVVFLAKESGWLVTENGHHYCPNCKSLNDDDEWETKDGSKYSYDGEERTAIPIDIAKQICSRLNYPYSIYNPLDIKVGFPLKDCGCYIIQIKNDIPNIFCGLYKDGHFYTAHFTSAEEHKSDKDFKQRVYSVLADKVDAYIEYKN